MKKSMGVLSLVVVAGCAVPNESEEATSAIGQTSEAFSVTSAYIDLPRRGGTGGVVGTPLHCDDTRDVVVGLYGRSGNVIDSLGLYCARLRSDGTLGTVYQAQTVRGGSGGDYPFNARCPSGMAVTGLFGNAVTYVDRIGVICSEAPFADHVVRSGSWHPEWSSAFGDYCDDNYPITSIAVRSGTVIDAVRGRCTYVGTH